VNNTTIVVVVVVVIVVVIVAHSGVEVAGFANGKDQR
jgi:hypothetical protein